MVWEDLATQDAAHCAHRLALSYFFKSPVRVVGGVKRSFLRQCSPQRIDMGLEGGGSWSCELSHIWAEVWPITNR